MTKRRPALGADLRALAIEWLFAAGLLARCRDVDLHLARLGFLALWKLDGQHAIFVLGCDRVGIDGVGQSEAPAEGTVGTLDAQVTVVLDVGFSLALAADGEHVVLNADVEILFAHA